MPELTQKQIDIISAMAFEDMNVARVAELMRLHRNSVTWHLEQIKKKTGLDPRNFFDLHELFRLTGGDDDADQETAM